MPGFGTFGKTLRTVGGGGGRQLGMGGLSSGGAGSLGRLTSKIFETHRAEGIEVNVGVNNVVRSGGAGGGGGHPGPQPAAQTENLVKRAVRDEIIPELKRSLKGNLRGLTTAIRDPGACG